MEEALVAEHLRDAMCATIVAIEKNGAANSLAAEKIGAANQLAVEKTGSANILAGYQNFAALQLQACNNHADAMAATAKCCCETKELIAAQNQQTRDLVNDIERSRNATDLADAKQEILIATLSRGNGHD